MLRTRSPRSVGCAHLTRFASLPSFLLLTILLLRSAPHTLRTRTRSFGGLRPPHSLRSLQPRQPPGALDHGRGEHAPDRHGIHGAHEPRHGQRHVGRRRGVPMEGRGGRVGGPEHGEQVVPKEVGRAGAEADDAPVLPGQRLGARRPWLDLQGPPGCRPRADQDGPRPPRVGGGRGGAAQAGVHQHSPLGVHQHHHGLRVRRQQHRHPGAGRYE